MPSTAESHSVEPQESAASASSEQPKKKRRLNITDYMTKTQSHSTPPRVKTDQNADSQSNAKNVSDSNNGDSSTRRKGNSNDHSTVNQTPSCNGKSHAAKANKSPITTSPTRKSDQSTSSSTILSITESIGDIFDAPKGTLIIHSCNCQGSWGAGIAAAFKSHYPCAYKTYAARCRKWKDQLFESAQLIPPQSGDAQGHFVGCLYTSRHYGKKRDTPAKILAATRPAMRDLLEQVQEWNEAHGDGERVQEVRMCMINSGLFAVPWRETREVLEGIDVSRLDVKEIEVVSRE